MLGAVIAKPTYFFAPVGGWSSDVIINPANFHTAAMTVSGGYTVDGRYHALQFYNEKFEGEPMVIFPKRSDVRGRKMSDMSFTYFEPGVGRLISLG